MKKRCLLFALAALLLMSMLTGCGSSSWSGASADTTMPESAAQTAAEDVSEVYYGEAASLNVPSSSGDSEAKLIYTADLDLETTDFDAAVEALQDLAADCGGYFESSSVDGGSGYRSACYTVRIPADLYRTFLDQAGQLCHMTRFSEYAEDVSEVYYDTAGRLETQQTKLDRLRELLERAESMEDIIAIESAIAETEEQIDRLSGELRHYDALVDYSTVNIYLDEVYRLSNVEEPAQGFKSRIASALAGGWNGFISGIETAAVALAYCWMWLLLAAAIAVTVLLVHRSVKGRAKKPKAVPAAYTAPDQTTRKE